ncbi:MAG: hypothetical protein RLZZ127_1612 [Planctomycetota bacterium]|jgi:H+/Cl- antiporter ClcA
MEPADRGDARRPGQRSLAWAFVWILMYTVFFTWLAATWLHAGRVEYHARGTSRLVTVAKHRDPGWYTAHVLAVGGIAIYGWFQLASIATTGWIGRHGRPHSGGDAG